MLYGLKRERLIVYGSQNKKSHLAAQHTNAAGHTVKPANAQQQDRGLELITIPQLTPLEVRYRLAASPSCASARNGGLAMR
jgi:hypothetical protein